MPRCQVTYACKFSLFFENYKIDAEKIGFLLAYLYLCSKNRNMEESALNRYRDEIGKGTLLTDEQERELSAKILKGDERALSRLVEANLKFVVSVARQYKGQGLAMEDLVSEGNMGLMKAAARFDATKGVRFVNYAVVHVRQAIEKAIEQQTGLYKVPKDVKDELAARQQSMPLSVDAPLGHRANLSPLPTLCYRRAGGWHSPDGGRCCSR